MGSGHILVYMFDVLVQIYEAYGYSARDAARSIVEHNLYGLDIDERSAQLAYFSVMMKARSYDRRFFSRGLNPHVYTTVESNGLSELWMTDNAEMRKLFDCMKDAKAFGALLMVPVLDFDGLRRQAVKQAEQITTETLLLQEQLPQVLMLIDVAEMLAGKYEIVCTNPPYMATSNAKQTNYIKKYYPDSKSDFFAASIERCEMLTAKNGYQAMITMESWMFLSSFEKLRYKVNQTKTIINMVHMPYLGKGGTSLGINFGTAAFIMKTGYIPDYNGQYEYTVYYECDENGVPFEFPTKNERWKTAQQSNFSKIPGSPVAYWVSKRFYDTYSYPPIGDTIIPRHGLATSDNNRFLKLWFEVSIRKESIIQRCDFTRKWFPMNKGGAFRKWYGNLEWVINYENDGREIKDYAIQLYRSSSRTIQNTQFYFREGITWSALTSGALSFRWTDVGAIFGSGAHCAFAEDSDTLLYGLALLNGKVSASYLNIISPTLNTNVDDIRATPFIEKNKALVVALVRDCIQLSKTDWDSFETSWDFKVHPFVWYSKGLWDCTNIAATIDYFYGCKPDFSCPIEICYLLWQGECQDRFNRLKANEEELNRIFIDIYGLQDELTPEVDDKDVTVRLADKTRDVKSLISYAVGCMFGRYSLDREGLVYAGGEWDERRYTIFPADKDNIIPICDDEYFTDDIVGRFVEFIRTVYGEAKLDENLKFIADALGGKGQPKEVIRNYFLNDFYADHLKIYQKRPIYWLFDSGRKNGFKCLIYMHRYRPDTIARIRTDYVHEQQARYRTAIADLEHRVANAATSERVKLNKQLTKLQAQADELREYEEKIHHLADQMIAIDLDDGVKKNYALFKDVLAKIK